MNAVRAQGILGRPRVCEVSDGDDLVTGMPKHLSHDSTYKCWSLLVTQHQDCGCLKDSQGTRSGHKLGGCSEPVVLHDRQDGERQRAKENVSACRELEFRAKREGQTLAGSLRCVFRFSMGPFPVTIAWTKKPNLHMDMYDKVAEFCCEHMT